ncbi:MAG TPA: 6,7-dimethyl-8-ribityllumazine synthase [Rhodopila sp.]|uniref:6,7-dimethyl-8-ribityllumazine synthase n=1 Tax=Rhodopila sp. TaxID=2480087 RepID=UPI002BAA596F|nr:6,7-dimethyl-8-ribityllumazine synthase [Rhodopila sp.]HVY16928.1 6,7-dimethyl-8-ribityllumazine synthase [Rhodopila sp.]
MSTADAPIPRAPKIKGVAPHFLIVRAPYYREVVDNLTTGARSILTEAGATSETLDVAGAYELPQAIRLALRGSRKYNGYVALGCIIRGETDHYEFISKSTMDGLMNVALQFGLCLGTGLLTCDTMAQAQARSTLDGFNKGSEAAVASVMQLIAAQHFGAA